MNPKNSWQYQPLSVEKQSQRDALIRIMVRVMRELAKRKLVPHHNYSCEQLVERKIARRTPGLYDYIDTRVEYASTEWLREHAEGRLRMEFIVQVDAEDRTVGDGMITEGEMISEVFAAELALLVDQQMQMARVTRPQRPKSQSRTKPKPRAKVKPKTLKLHQYCLFED